MQRHVHEHRLRGDDPFDRQRVRAVDARPDAGGIVGIAGELRQCPGKSRVAVTRRLPRELKRLPARIAHAPREALDSDVDDPQLVRFQQRSTHGTILVPALPCSASYTRSSDVMITALPPLSR